MAPAPRRLPNKRMLGPMMRPITLAACLALGLGAGAALAAEEAHVHDFSFSFEGPFGAYDQNQLQRGLQIYTEVCSACHGLRYVPIRTIGDEGGPGIPEDQVRAYAANVEVFDPSLNDGQGDFRPATPNDHFPHNTSAGAPDLSLMAKGRAGFHGPYGLGISQLFKGIGGPEYIATLLTSYEEAPDCAPADFPGNYNTAFAAGGYPDECKIYEEREVVKPDGTTLIEKVEVGRQVPGSWIAMGQPLYGEDVTFADGHSAELEHEAEDVAAFLMWAAEPKMMARKQAGFTGVLMLTIMTVLLYLTNKRLWAPVKKAAKDTSDA